MTTHQPISLFRCAAGGIACAIGYLSLAVVSREYGDAGLLHVLFVYALAWVLSVWVAWPVAGAQTVTGAVRGVRSLWWMVLGFGVLFRLLGTLTFPVLEDDFYRYMWDGWQVANSGFPYAQSPATYFGDTTLPPEMSAVLDGINYPDVATVYGPFLQLLFGLGYFLAPGQVAPLQVLDSGVSAGFCMPGHHCLSKSLRQQRIPMCLGQCLLSVRYGVALPVMCF